MPPDSSSTAATPSVPAYRGLSGAVRYGLALAAGMTGLGLAGGAMLWGATGDGPFSLFLVGRLMLLAWVLGAAGALARLVSGWQSNRLFSWDYEPGDLGSIAGLLAAVILPGALIANGAASPASPAIGPRVGEPVELAGPTVDGGRFDLADYRGRVVLVDFWATWCGPCLRELPNILETWEAYHGKGLEAVSVSLDFERERLVRFLDENPLPWPQVFFDEDGKRGWDNPLVGSFGVSGIPFLMIVDREGKVAVTGVRGAEIPAAVAAALGDPTAEPGLLAATHARVKGWSAASVMEAAWWLVAACGLGTAVAVSLAEAALRRITARKHPATS